MQLVKKLLYVLFGLALTSIGIKLLSDNFLTFGGTAGIATVAMYLTNNSWGILFLIVNLPFFIISIQKLGKWFTISSLLSITGISLLRDWIDIMLPSLHMNIILAALLAGMLIGVGVTFVLNNGSSLGGIHILGLFVEEKYNINRGIILFGCDGLIVLFALAYLGWYKALLSIVCITIASLLIGRYKKSPIHQMQQDQEDPLIRNTYSS